MTSRPTTPTAETAPTDLPARVLAGDPRAMARAMSLVEDEAAAGLALIARLHPHSGRAYLVGVTGAPGAGKSTLVDQLVREIRAAGLTVGVVAVDPSSPFTGGAILGDRVRMGAHAGDAGVFIRSMATRGHLGGLARATADVALVLDASGKDVVVIETVGVGQDEVDIVGTADCSVVVLVPGTGDDVQTMKAGIMEIADVFVVNKADREGADRLVQSVKTHQGLRASVPTAWQPPVLPTEAHTGKGVAEVWAAIGHFRAQGAEGHAGRRRLRDRARLRDQLTRALLAHVEHTLPTGAFERAVDGIAARQVDPRTAATDLLSQVVRS